VTVDGGTYTLHFCLLQFLACISVPHVHASNPIPNTEARKKREENKNTWRPLKRRFSLDLSAHTWLHEGMGMKKGAYT
jgi:hypothetical protein